MSKPIKKSRIVINGSKLLGSLIYFKDKQDRYSIKFSFKKKIGQMALWEEKLDTGKIIPIDGTKEASVSLDISYKFPDSLLEIKREQPGYKPIAKFVKLPLPMKAYLFAIRIKNWHSLPDVIPDNDTLSLTPPKNGNKASILFSFTGENGLPFVDDIFRNGNGFMIFSPIPREAPFNHIFVGISEDEENNANYDVILKIPNEFS